MLTATLSAMSNTDTPVTFSTVSAAAVTLSPNSLTIPAGMTRGTVTLTAVDDNTDALNKRVIVSGLASNAHGIAGNPEPRTLRIQDDDPAPTVTLELAPNPIGENGGESMLTATLSHPSIEATTVTVSADPAAVRLSPNSLTIPAGETAGTVTLTVTAKDNNIHGPETTTVTVSADAENRLGVTDPAGATLTIQDDDGPPTVTLAVSPNPIPENGGVSTLTARLDWPSSRPIVVTVAPDPAYTLDGNPTLTFPAGTTARQGTVVLTAKDNAIDAADATVSVGGTANPSLTVAAAELTITDNDTRGVMVSEHTLAIKEGGNPGTYTVVLASEPTSPVTIAVASSDAAVRVNPPSLGFTAANWQTAQTVTVDAANDEVENNPPKTATITHTVTWRRLRRGERGLRDRDRDRRRESVHGCDPEREPGCRARGRRQQDGDRDRRVEWRAPLGPNRGDGLGHGRDGHGGHRLFGVERLPADNLAGSAERNGDLCPDARERHHRRAE